MATLLKTATLTNIDANSYTDWYKMKVEVYLNSQTNSTNSCSSNITIKRYFGTQAAKAGWYSYSTPKLTSLVSVDGGSYGNSSSTSIKNLEQYNAGNWVQFGSWTGNITHRTDGSQSINVKLAFTAGTTTSYVSKDATLTTGSFDLPTIPRNATIDSVNILSVENGFYISYTKPLDTSYVQLVVKYGNIILRTYNEENITNTTLQLYETLESLYQVTSSEANPTFTFELTTYTDSTLTTKLGDTSIKSASTSITNANPIFTDFDYKDVDETTVLLTGDDQKLILGYSNVQFEITEENQAIGQKGASIDAYEFVLNEGTAMYSGDELPCSFISTNHKHSTLSVYAHDTRGYWTKATKTPSAITNYTRPVINNFEALRIGNVEPNVRLVLNAKLWSGNFGTGDNILTHVAYRVCPVGGTYSEWIDITDTVTQIAGTSGTINVTEENNVFLYSDGVSANFTTGQAYNVQLLVCDGTEAITFNTTATDTYEITDGMVLDSYYKTSTGYRYAINGIVDPDGDVLQVYDDDGNLITKSEVVASETEPTTGEELWLRTRPINNIKNTVSWMNYYVASDGTFKVQEEYGCRCMNQYYAVKSNTTYTFEILETTDNYEAWIGIGEYDTNKGFIIRHVNNTPGAIAIQFTTTSTTKYIVISAHNLANATVVNLVEGRTSNKTYIKNSSGYEEYVGVPYRVGDVLVTSTNNNPGKMYGGVWNCIDKEFASAYFYSTDVDVISEYITPNTTNATPTAFGFIRNNHIVYVRYFFTTAVTFADTSLNVGTMLFEKFGIKDGLYLAIYDISAGSDAGEGIVLMNVSAVEGQLYSSDVIMTGSSTTMASGKVIRFEFEIKLPTFHMLDSACDKFYWKKVAD